MIFSRCARAAGGSEWTSCDDDTFLVFGQAPAADITRFCAGASQCNLFISVYGFTAAGYEVRSAESGAAASKPVMFAVFAASGDANEPTDTVDHELACAWLR